MDNSSEHKSGSIWFWWIIMTLIYSVLTFLMTDESVGTPFGYLFGFTGLFVPYGPMSLMLFLTPPTWISLIVFIAAMRYAQRKLQNQNVALGLKVILIFASLLLITILVDLIRFTPFQSWAIFLAGGKPNFSF